MTSEIDKLKHFYIEDYSGIYFTDELNAGEDVTVVFENGGFVGNLGLSKNYRKSILRLAINIELILIK